MTNRGPNGELSQNQPSQKGVVVHITQLHYSGLCRDVNSQKYPTALWFKWTARAARTLRLPATSRKNHRIKHWQSWTIMKNNKPITTIDHKHPALAIINDDPHPSSTLSTIRDRHWRLLVNHHKYKYIEHYWLLLLRLGTNFITIIQTRSGLHNAPATKSSPAPHGESATYNSVETPGLKAKGDGHITAHKSWAYIYMVEHIALVTSYIWYHQITSYICWTYES